MIKYFVGSDRYKVFLDLTNLASFLVTRDRIPPLTMNIKKSLSVHDWVQEIIMWTENDADSEEDSTFKENFTKMLRKFSKTSLGNSDNVI